MADFPYDPDWTYPLTVSKRVIESTTVSGAYKGRVKGTKKQMFELKFEARDTTEFDAALDFWDDHYPGLTFTFKDRSFDPVRNVTCRFASNFRDDSVEGYNLRNYSFVIVEA